MSVSMICPNGHEGSIKMFAHAFELWRSKIKYYECSECGILFRPPIAAKGEIGVVVRKRKGNTIFNYHDEVELLPYSDLELELKQIDRDEYLRIMRTRKNFNFDICGMCNNKECEINKFGGTKVFVPYKDGGILQCDGLKYSNGYMEEYNGANTYI